MIKIQLPRLRTILACLVVGIFIGVGIFFVAVVWLHAEFPIPSDLPRHIGTNWNKF